MTRKEWTLYGSFLQNLGIGQKLKKIKILLLMYYSGFSPPVIIIGEVSTYAREEIFLHEVCPFLLPDTVWVVFAKFRNWSKIKKKLNPFTDVIFRFQSTCHYNWQGKHICQRVDIPS